MPMIDDPLPHQYLLTSEDGVGGCIKQRPDDFIVEELPLYEPCGEGEHLYLGVRKVGLSHGDALRKLARHFNVDERAIGFAGMKDKQAVTVQTFSIHTPSDAPEEGVLSDKMEIVWSNRHRNKLRRGHLRGNHFSIRIRHVDPLKAPSVLRALRRLMAEGLPNYFGDQRFGYRCNTHRLGAAVLRRQWKPLLDELLGSAGSTFPAHQAEARRLYDDERYAEALAIWAVSDRAEREALRALASGRPADRAVRCIGRRTVGFWMNATQSAIFNALLDERIVGGGLCELTEGDLAWKHDSRSVFAVTAEELGTGELEPRLRRMEISPSGPLWGWNMTRTAGTVGEREQDALAASGLSLQDLENPPVALEGARRSFRVQPAAAEVESGLDEEGGCLVVRFDLPRGSYATVLLREIMKTDQSAGGSSAPESGHVPDED